MSADRDTTRIVRSWLEEGATALPDRVLDAVLDQVPATSQRRPLWPARRFREMNNTVKLAIAAVAVVVVAVVGITLLPRSGGVGGSGPGPTSRPGQTAAPSPIASPSASGALTGFPEAPLQAGTHTFAPFAPPDGEGVCHAPPQPGCTESDLGDLLRFTAHCPRRLVRSRPLDLAAGQWEQRTRRGGLVLRARRLAAHRSMC